MTDVSEQQPGPGEERGWADRVTVAPGTGGGGGFAYVPGQVVTDDAGRALDLARVLFPRDDLRTEDPDLQRGRFARVVNVPDVPRLIRHLQSFGVHAQPNHVFFAHGADGCCCGPHPALRGGCGGGPGASPVYASPV